jgi:hypothetical protein
MAEEVQELVVKMRPEGVDETTQELEDQEQAFEEAAGQAEQSAGVMDEFVGKFQGAMQAVVAGLAVAAGGLLSQVPIIGELASGLFAIIESLALKIDEVLRPVLEPVSDALFDIASGIDEADGAFGDFIGTIAGIIGVLGLAEGAIVGLNAALGTAIPSIVGTIVGILGGPVTAVLLALIALIGGLALAWSNNWGNIRGITQEAVSRLRELINGLIAFLRPKWAAFTARLEALWNRHMPAILREGRQVFTQLKQIAMTVFNALKPFIAAAALFIKTVILSNWDIIVATTTILWSVIKNTILTALDGILTGIRVLLAILQGDWQQAWSLIKGFTRRTTDRIQAVATTTFSAMATAVASIFRRLKGNIIAIGAALNAAIRRRFMQITSGVVDLAGFLATLLQRKWTGIKQTARSAWNGLKRAISQILGQIKSITSDRVDAIISTFQRLLQRVRSLAKRIEDAMPDVGVPDVNVGGGGGGGGLFGGFSVPSLQSGGRITSGGLANLHEGERVQPAEVDRGGGGGHAFAGQQEVVIRLEQGLEQFISAELEDSVLDQGRI